MKALGTLTAIAAVLAVLVATQAPASAHGGVVFHGRDKAVIAEDHLEGFACDEEKDGHLVYAEFQTPWGLERVFDEDGSKGECWSRVFPGGAASQYRVCEETKGCTRWYST
jgi:hypothetical protein